MNTYEYHLIQDRTGLSDKEIFDRIGGLLVTQGAQGAELTVDGQAVENSSRSARPRLLSRQAPVTHFAQD